MWYEKPFFVEEEGDNINNLEINVDTNVKQYFWYSNFLFLFLIFYWYFHCIFDIF